MVGCLPVVFDDRLGFHLLPASKSCFLLPTLGNRGQAE